MLEAGLAVPEPSGGCQCPFGVDEMRWMNIQGRGFAARGASGLGISRDKRSCGAPPLFGIRDAITASSAGAEAGSRAQRPAAAPKGVPRQGIVLCGLIHAAPNHPTSISWCPAGRPFALIPARSVRMPGTYRLSLTIPRSLNFLPTLPHRVARGKHLADARFSSWKASGLVRR